MAATRGSPPPPRQRQIRPRPRLALAAAIGAVAAGLVPVGPNPSLRAVIGWDSGAVVYLGLVMIMAARANPASMRRRAEAEDLARWAFLGLMAGAAFFSMFAIFGMVGAGKDAAGKLPAGLIALGGVTILLSWLFAHIAFALHYARDYFADLAASREAGLAFPGRHEPPDYWDFLYFSFVIGMTCQVSDVQVTTRPWRRLVLIHGLVAFLFNTVVLALSINLAAGLL